MKRLIVAALIVLPVIALSYWALTCPCDRVPGLYLRGTEAGEKVTDWSFANQVPLCQVQVDTGLLPHALNLNCWADGAGELYLGCASCDGKRWSSAAVAHAEARLRLGQTVYPVNLSRIVDEGELDRVWASRALKFGAQNQPRSAGWWSFRVVSR